MKKEPRSPMMLGPLIPWLCSYKSKIGRCSIVLYSMSEKDILENNEAILPQLSVDGVLYGIMPFSAPTEGEA